MNLIRNLVFVLAVFASNLGWASEALKPSQSVFSGELVLEVPDGSKIVLRGDKGPCQSNARSAVIVAPKKETINGCWIIERGHVVIGWMDGEHSIIPQGYFKYDAGT